MKDGLGTRSKLISSSLPLPLPGWPASAANAGRSVAATKAVLRTNERVVMSGVPSNGGENAANVVAGGYISDARVIRSEGTFCRRADRGTFNEDSLEFREG